MNVTEFTSSAKLAMGIGPRINARKAASSYRARGGVEPLDRSSSITLNHTLHKLSGRMEHQYLDKNYELYKSRANVSVTDNDLSNH